jgi:tetrahydromethanopterin S-methyltransferase subunit G
VDELHRYLESLGMRVSVDKSQTSQMVTKKSTWFDKDPKIKIGENKISEVNPEEAFRYLGAKIGPWKGVNCGIVVPEILSMVRRVRKLSLKPCQKIELLLKYIFPRFIYQLLINPPEDGVLKLMDSEVRQKIKSILHLVPSTATGFFYAPRNFGSLRLPRFVHIVKLGTLRSALKIKDS